MQPTASRLRLDPFWRFRSSNDGVTGDCHLFETGTFPADILVVLTDDGLGAMWGKEMAMQYFQEAGFGSVQVHELAHDIQYYYYVCRP